jgi:hypothetical protein
VESRDSTSPRLVIDYKNYRRSYFFFEDFFAAFLAAGFFAAFFLAMHYLLLL